MKAQLLALPAAVSVCASALAADFEFVVIGDTRPRFESESFHPFEILIGKINDLKPALVVNLGDLIYGYGMPSKEKQWNKYQTVIKSIQPPYYQLPGNHDTHSKAARRIYGRRFGQFYQSFDYADCHFVLLDNTEAQRWGFIGAAQLDWLRRDLAQARGRSVFVFMHFPLWEPERIAPACYDCWARILHPLFKASRVKAVFAGHYHTYGPTREFDGIPYFITGGGGAELIPEYRKSGGQYHFLRVKVSGESFDLRVITERGEMTDPEADIMGGLQFAARHVSRIGIRPGAADLRSGMDFNVVVANPYPQEMSGQANWICDGSAFEVQPASVPVHVPAGGTHQYSFTLKALREITTLPSLPRLQFSVAAGGRRHRFHREVRFLDELDAAYRRTGPVLDAHFDDWVGAAKLYLGRRAQLPQAQISSCFDDHALYLALTVPRVDRGEAEELGFADEVQIGLARRLSNTDFSSDLLRLGIKSGLTEVQDRTPGRKPHPAVREIKTASRADGGHMRYEVSVPLRLLRELKAIPGKRLIMDLAFPVPDGGPESPEPPDPAANSFSYRVRYGSDSLVPVYFVELNLERRGNPP